jgi:secreted trypsin-like serine protease
MTIRIYIIFNTLSSVCSTSADDHSRDLGSRIILGKVANAKRYPYYTYLDIVRYSSSHSRCGGSLVASDMVLTAAHCIDDDKPITSITAKVNYTQSIDFTGQPTGYEHSRTVIRRIFYPYYNWLKNEGDLGLLLLDSPITEVKPVNMNDLWNSPYVGQPLTVVGHGTMAFGVKDRPDYLMEVSVPTISYQDCNDGNSYNGKIIDRAMICAGAGGKDSCSGDSGGPLVILGTNSSEDIQVGIVSFGRQCGLANYPGIYTRISTYLDWVQETICQTSNNKPSFCFNATLSPTMQPTKRPTKNPTKTPTKNPTRNPTKNPTRSPTKNPTRNPTRLPLTLAPIVTPTSIPTVGPILAPTDSPTVAPTDALSSLPTIIPTIVPTNVPSNDTPSNVPMEIPTDIPTESMPTNVPIEVPTNHPTESIPSSSPIEVPTDIPTETLPTGSPFDVPTEVATDASTIGPTDASPSLPPMDAATNTPTSALSSFAHVVFLPTSSPTPAPTSSPTTFP